MTSIFILTLLLHKRQLMEKPEQMQQWFADRKAEFEMLEED
jgi:hypothetical protein